MLNGWILILNQRKYNGCVSYPSFTSFKLLMTFLSGPFVVKCIAKVLCELRAIHHMLLALTTVAAFVWHSGKKHSSLYQDSGTAFSVMVFVCTCWFQGVRWSKFRPECMQWMHAFTSVIWWPHKSTKKHPQLPQVCWIQLHWIWTSTRAWGYPAIGANNGNGVKRMKNGWKESDRCMNEHAQSGRVVIYCNSCTVGQSCGVEQC